MIPHNLHRWLSCGLALLLLAGGAAAQNLKEQENRKARLEKEIAILDGQLRAAAKESESAIGRLSLIRKKVASRRELVEESDRKIAVYNRAINEKQQEIEQVLDEKLMAMFHDPSIRITYQWLDEIPVDPNGKLRVIISKVQPGAIGEPEHAGEDVGSAEISSDEE